jgi:hypothetical protein
MIVEALPAVNKSCSEGTEYACFIDAGFDVCKALQSSPQVIAIIVTSLSNYAKQVRALS